MFVFLHSSTIILICSRFAEGTQIYILHEGFLGVFGDELKEEDYDDIEKEKFSINSSKEILESISKFENYFKNETLISVIKNNLDEMDFKTNFKIDDYSIEIGVSKLD